MEAPSPSAEIDELAEDAAVPHNQPRWAPVALAAFVGLVVCSNVAAASWVRMGKTNPGRLLMFSSRNRYLVQALTNGLPLLSYVVIAFVRLTVAFLVCHLIGRAYGDKVLYWFRRYLGFNRKQIDGLQNGFEKGQWVLIPLLVGSNLVAVVSGVHRTSARRLFGLLSVGIAGRLLLMWWLARTFERQLQSFLNWLDQYQRPLLIGSIVLVVVANLRNFRRGAGA